MVADFTINPAHQHFKQYYYQEFDDRERYIHDRIYPPYISQDRMLAFRGFRYFEALSEGENRGEERQRRSLAC